MISPRVMRAERPADLVVGDREGALPLGIARVRRRQPLCNRKTMIEGIDCLVERGSRDRKVAKLNPTPDALPIKSKQLPKRSLGCLMVLGEPLDRGLFFQEWNKS
jgi:hypothetical protein